MKRFLQIYLAFFKQQLKALMEYKVDFMMGMIALGVQQISTFLVLLAVFTQIKAIGTYDFNEILLFYGYSQIIRGIDHIYNDNIWTVGWGQIRDGSFSKYLVRPINTITHIIMERVQFDGIGEFIIGIIVFIYAKGKLGLSFGLEGSLVFTVFVISGLVIYFAIKLLCAAVAFWTTSSGELMTVTYEINSFNKYPLDIYKSLILKTLLLYILPFAVVSYVPMAYFLRDSAFIGGVLGFNYGARINLVVFSVVVAIISMIVAKLVWNEGLKRYNASGN